jgi:hypothetical protein
MATLSGKDLESALAAAKAQGRGEVLNEQRHNGWTNYETWNVSLWIDNDEGTYNSWRREAEECWADAEADETFTREENATAALAARLKTHFDDDMHEMGVPELKGFYADLLNAALSEVNWHEIAGHMIEGVDKAADEAETEEV